VFDDLAVDYIEFYVGDIPAATRWLAEGYGLRSRAVSAAIPLARARSAGLGQGSIRVILTEPAGPDHRGTAYLARHGDGVADIALRVPDAAAAFEEAVRRGACPVARPAVHDGVVTATIVGFADVTHTFVQRPDDQDSWLLPGLRPVPPSPAGNGTGTGLEDVDHFAVVLNPGQVDETAEFYREVLDFELIFHDRIVVGDQAIITTALQSRSGALTYTLIEPDPTQAPGHVYEFLRSHGGPGVQHIAFRTRNIVESVDSLGSRGVAFLPTPARYYRLLTDRLTPARYSVDELRRRSILVDEDHDGQLLQIFTQSVHPRNTIFLEVIERIGARSFGNGNIKALYEAVEQQRGAEEEAA
jgi:4-hydroxymandelate synthase